MAPAIFDQAQYLIYSYVPFWATLTAFAVVGAMIFMVVLCCGEKRIFLETPNKEVSPQSSEKEDQQLQTARSTTQERYLLRTNEQYLPGNDGPQDQQSVKSIQLQSYKVTDNKTGPSKSIFAITPVVICTDAQNVASLRLMSVRSPNKVIIHETSVVDRSVTGEPSKKSITANEPLAKRTRTMEPLHSISVSSKRCTVLPANKGLSPT